jgi:uncharacterized membrane protein YdjX (TVP38/TMEM64 family)
VYVEYAGDVVQSGQGYPHWMPRLRLFGLIALVAGAFVAAALLLPHSPADLRSLIGEAGVLAPAMVVGAWILLTPAMFSGTLLAAASGLAFGAFGGAALSVVGAVLGGLAAFALARTVARSQVEALLLRRPRFQRIHGLLERRGFLATLTARLLPGIPATGLHYAAGVSPVRTWAFAGAIAVGALLRTTPYAVLGQGIGSGSLATIVFASVSVAVGGLAAAVLVRRLRLPAPV